MDGNLSLRLLSFNYPRRFTYNPTSPITTVEIENRQFSSQVGSSTTESLETTVLLGTRDLRMCLPNQSFQLTIAFGEREAALHTQLYTFYHWGISFP
jgi:hypothetical protein